MPYGRALPPARWLALTGAIYAFGIAVRIAWANAAEPWKHASDHLAWGLLLREALAGPVRADQLFHFPHEGWSVVEGVLGFLIARLSAIDPAEALAWAALAIDSVGRAIQIAVVAVLFGLRVALVFTVWSAVGNLLLIENATAAYGGHLALSLWPLVALAIVLHPPSTRASAMVAGAVLGLSAALGNQDLILVVVVVAMIGRATLAATAIGTALALLFVRTRIDLGFHLVGFDWWNIRGVGIRPGGALEILRASSAVLFDHLPASFALGAPTVVVGAVTLWLCAGLVRLGRTTSTRFVGAVVGIFATGYGLLFANELPRWPFDAIDLRYLGWLAPTLAALAIAGWDALGRWGPATVLLPVAATLHAARGTTEMPQTEAAAWDGAGFWLATKLGHDPRRLEALARGVPAERLPDFWGGAGAGLGEAALRDRDTAQRAVDLLESFPLERRPALAEGTGRRLLKADATEGTKFAATVWSGRVRRAGMVAPVARFGVLLYGPGAVAMPDDADTGLRVLASGTSAAGEAPLLELWVDQGLAKTVPIGADAATYDLGPVPSHARVELRYTNDLVDAEGNDRNLMIHWIDRRDAPVP